MRTYTNPYSQEVTHVMTEAELRAFKKQTIIKHKEFKKRKFRRRLLWIAEWAFKITAVSVAWLAVLLFFWCQIPPM